MIADLKADSARWEAETARRHREGAPRGKAHHSHAGSLSPPNRSPEPYVSAYDAPTRSPGAIYGSTRYSDPVYPPTTVPYVAPAASAAYPYTQPPGYIPAPVYDAAQPPYAPVARPPPVSGADVSAGFAAYNGAAPYDYGARPPRFPPVSPYDGEPDYPVSTGIGYAPPVAAVAPDVYPHVPRNVRRH